jgi:hypothetical protein
MQSSADAMSLSLLEPRMVVETERRSHSETKAKGIMACRSGPAGEGPVQKTCDPGKSGIQQYMLHKIKTRNQREEQTEQICRRHGQDAVLADEHSAPEAVLAEKGRNDALDEGKIVSPICMRSNSFA